MGQRLLRIRLRKDRLAVSGFGQCVQSCHKLPCLGFMWTCLSPHLGRYQMARQEPVWFGKKQPHCLPRRLRHFASSDLVTDMRSGGSTSSLAFPDVSCVGFGHSHWYVTVSHFFKFAFSYWHVTWSPFDNVWLPSVWLLWVGGKTFCPFINKFFFLLVSFKNALCILDPSPLLDLSLQIIFSPCGLSSPSLGIIVCGADSFNGSEVQLASNFFHTSCLWCCITNGIACTCRHLHLSCVHFKAFHSFAFDI